MSQVNRLIQHTAISCRSELVREAIDPGTQKYRLANKLAPTGQCEVSPLSAQRLQLRHHTRSSLLTQQLFAQFAFVIDDVGHRQRFTRR